MYVPMAGNTVDVDPVEAIDLGEYDRYCIDEHRLPRHQKEATFSILDPFSLPASFVYTRWLPDIFRT